LGYNAEKAINTIVANIEVNGIDRALYLAVPALVYESFFQREFLQVSIERYQIPLIIYEPQQEVIEQWIN
jgi:XisH protein